MHKIYFKGIHYRVPHTILKSGMRALCILPFVISLCGCVKRSQVSTFTQTVEEPSLYSENIVESQLIKSDTENEREEDKEEEEKAKIICIHICGAVRKPGVYQLKDGSRVYEAVCAAGGYTPDADEDYVNQALILSDSDKLVIPTVEQTSKLTQEDVEAKTDSFGVEGSLAKTGKQEEASGKININTASIEQLCTLSGIGEARAKVIINYRTENGPFTTIEDIMNVSGIKQASFDKIKYDICVN